MAEGCAFVNNKKILTILLATVIIGMIVFVILNTSTPKKTETTPQNSYFSVDEIGGIGDDAYIVYSAAGEGNARLLSLTNLPSNDIYVLEQKGFGNENFQEFMNRLKSLEKYNFSVHGVGPEANPKHGTYIIPTGAMPLYALEKIKAEDNVTFIYIGQTNLVIRSTIKKEDWYSGLDDEIKKKIILSNITPDEMLKDGKGMDAFLADIVSNKWGIVSEKELNISGQQQYDDTAIFDTGDGKFIRIVYALGDIVGVYNLEMPEKKEKITTSGSMFTWEDGWADISLSKTNGTAIFTVEKNGKQVKEQKLERVSEESVFRVNLKFDESGEYILKATDNQGVVATGVIHVKNVGLKLDEIKATYYYVFSVKIDGEKLKDGMVNVSIKGSTGSAQQFIINDGLVTIPAKLAKGKGTFVFELLGGKTEVYTDTAQESVYDVYIKYGPVGILLVIVVYAIARINRKKTYTIRVGEVAPEIRKEIKISLAGASEIFQSARKELKLDGPLKTHEFAVGLRRKVTEGADITEGNVEEILKKMEKHGIVLGWNGYYQLAIEGRIKRNVMMRMIREKLIERGIHFKVNNDKFITRDFELGFFGERFRKKAIVVFEDGDELKKTLATVDEKERSKLFLKEFNGVLNLVPIDKLDDVL